MKTNKEARIQGMAVGFKGCTKDAYHKTEVLPELLKLQQEMIEILFPEASIEEQGHLKLWDIQYRLDDLSRSRHGKAGTEIAAFNESCKVVGNMIAAEISGKRGEELVFRRLANTGCSGSVVKNMEITDGDCRTEIDGIVLTDKAVFILEVKNTRKDVFIDESGNAYRTGKFTRHDCSLLKKMEARKMHLSKALASAGYPEVEIQGIVVYTNDRIEVQNRCESISVSFLSRLPYLIKEHSGESLYSDRDIEFMRIALEEMAARELYPIRFDTNLFKRQFAAAVIELNEPDNIRISISARLASLLEKAANRLNGSSSSNAQLPVSA